MIGVVLTLLCLLFALLYYISRRKFDYWKKRKIPYLKPAPILGNYGPFIVQWKYMGQVAQSICQKFPNEPYFGAFYGTEPALIVQDPEIIRLITTKDYYYFSNREIPNYIYKEVRTQNLFFTNGDRWKVIRQNLTPLFSTSKLKNMFYLIDQCAHALEDMLEYEVKSNNVIEVRPLMARFTMDCIGTCAFGVETKTMEKNSKNNPYTVIGTLIFLETYYRGFKIAARAIWPAIFYGLGFKCFPTEVDDFFYNLMLKVFAGRDYKPTNRNDFVDLILSWKKKKYIVGDSLQNMRGGDKKARLEVDKEMLVGQCIVFFAAGFETSATTLQYTLYELAKNQEAQQRAREEIDDYLKRHNNQLEYECVQELPFVEACFYEALRLYPVLGVLIREVVEDYTMPCGAVVGKGLRVHIPLYHLHHNPINFPDPEEYRPERFYGEAKKNIKPYTFMPFGEGPRTCIGMRFAKMQMIAGMVTVLKRYRLELAEGTPQKVDFISTTVVTHTRQKIRLKFIERENWQQRKYNKHD